MADRVKLTGLQLGMLTRAERNARVYLGRAGCLQSGFRDGCWLTAISLWLRGYLKRDGRIYWRGYGTPSIYLVITPAGRALLASNAGDD